MKRSENLGPLSYLVFVKVEFMEMGTPVSNKYYIGSPRGEVYGLDHTLTRFADPEVMVNLRPQTDIPGLVLTGNEGQLAYRGFPIWIFLVSVSPILLEQH